MSRLLVFTLIASFGSSSVALAGEGFTQSASRAIQETVRTPVTASSAVENHAPLIATQASTLLKRTEASKEALFAQEQPVVSKSGMSKSKKMLIYVAIGAGFTASAFAIDRHDLNLTPSSLGTRKD
jgi:Flp pilus assembly protein TadB